MRVNSSTRFAAMAALFGALACASNTARTADTDETAAARDTTVSDTTQNPPGYRGMETDTTMPSAGQQPSDTFLENQGVGQPQDTAGYSGMERPDTTGMQNQPSQIDTTGAAGYDTTGASSSDTSAAGQSSNPSGQAIDSTGQSTTGDTTGYDNTQNQQQSDTTTSR